MDFDPRINLCDPTAKARTSSSSTYRSSMPPLRPHFWPTVPNAPGPRHSPPRVGAIGLWPLCGAWIFCPPRGQVLTSSEAGYRWVTGCFVLTPPASIGTIYFPPKPSRNRGLLVPSSPTRSFCFSKTPPRRPSGWPISVSQSSGPRLKVFASSRATKGCACPGLPENTHPTVVCGGLSPVKRFSMPFHRGLGPTYLPRFQES